jgi:Family of unknown function (DUF5678)
MHAPARAPQPKETSYVERIREHVERDEVGAARRVLAEALQAGSDEPRLKSWAEILAPAKILGFSPPAETDRSAELRWFREHAKDYHGEWVAVLDDDLLAHAPTYEELRAQLDELKPARSPFAHFIE